MVLRGIVEGNPLLLVYSGRDQLSGIEQDYPQCLMSYQEKTLVLYILGQPQ
jgi:hypothetical protein